MDKGHGKGRVRVQVRVRVRVWIRIGIGIGIGIGIDASTVVCRESGGGIILNENKRCHHSPEVHQRMRQDSAQLCCHGAWNRVVCGVA